MSEPNFKGGTPGSEHVVFTYGKGMKQGDWKEHLQSLSGIAASSTKYGGDRLARAIKKMGIEKNPEPDKPDGKSKTLLVKKYERACKKWVKVEEEMEENNKNAYEIILKHCDPSMKMKLESTADFQRIEDEQDGIGLLKLLHSIYFQHDGAKQNIMELVKTEKKLFLIYQGKNESLDSYTRNFKALLETAKESGVAPGRNDTTAKLACAAGGADWDSVTSLAEQGDAEAKKALEEIRKEGQERFLAALHFDGLNHVAYANVKSDVHNGWLVQGMDTMPMRIDQTIRLCDRYDNQRAAQAGSTSTVSAVVCVQQGVEETPDEEDEGKAPEESASAGVALAQRGEEDKAVGTNATGEAAKQKGVRKNRRGEPIVFYSCGKNRDVLECPESPPEKRKEIIASTNSE